VKSQPTFSSLFVEKASFVKLDNATLGYNFNFKKQGIVKGLRAFINGQNLFVITDYTGVDPEVRYSYGGNVLAPGVDARDTWVYARTFTFGVNVKF
jgi:iron complex outermembrane receptor protein